MIELIAAVAFSQLIAKTMEITGFILMLSLIHHGLNLKRLWPQLGDREKEWATHCLCLMLPTFAFTIYYTFKLIIRIWEVL